MKNLFLNKNQSKKLMDMGFNELCFAHHLNNMFSDIPKQVNCKESISAPLFQQAHKFFRDNYDLSAEIRGDYADNPTVWYFQIIKKGCFSLDTLDCIVQRRFSSYGDAESAAIDRLIEITENNETRKVK